MATGLPGDAVQARAASDKVALHDGPRCFDAGRWRAAVAVRAADVFGVGLLGYRGYVAFQQEKRDEASVGNDRAVSEHFATVKAAQGQERSHVGAVVARQSVSVGNDDARMRFAAACIAEAAADRRDPGS